LRFLAGLQPDGQSPLCLLYYGFFVREIEVGMIYVELKFTCILLTISSSEQVESWYNIQWNINHSTEPSAPIEAWQAIWAVLSGNDGFGKWSTS